MSTANADMDVIDIEFTRDPEDPEDPDGPDDGPGADACDACTEGGGDRDAARVRARGMD